MPQTKYCVDCQHVVIPTPEEIKKASENLKRSERQNFQLPHKCKHPDNLDKITKEMLPCTTVRSDSGECGKNASKYESRS